MTVSILLARALIDGVGHAGVPQDRYLAAAAFDPCRLEQSDGRMSTEEYDALIECALDLTGDTAFGLHHGERTSAAAHQLAGHLVESASTLGDALDSLLRFHRLLVDKPGLRIEEQDQEARVVCDITPGPARCRRFRAEMAMAGFFRMVRYFGRGARPELVTFEHPAPAYRAEYTRLFGGVERFEQPFTGIAFDRALLSRVQLHNDAEFHRALEVQAETRLARIDRRATHAERVRDYLLEDTNRGHDMESVARGLGLSVRTLRRRLHEEGATFSGIASEAFAALAKRFLVDEARSVEETAYAMGFSAPTAFHKAFKRWTGTTPKEFRHRHARTATTH